VIDSRVQDADTLLENLLNTDRDIRLLRLDANTDGLSQITDKLQQLGNVSAVHLLTHGNDGEILLGSTVLNASTLAQHAPEFLAWQHNLTANADLLIYGCDVAGTPQGKDFVNSLAQLTAADVAASVDATGSANYGGNWDLEYATGVIETTAFFTTDVQQNWLGKLAVINVTTFADTVDGNVTSVANLLANKGSDGAISLREAILAVNAGSGGDTINLSSGTYTLSIAGNGENAATTGDLDILKSVTITGQGMGSTVISGGGLDRVFHILSGASLGLTDATISGGVVAANSWGGGLLVDGGGSLALSRVVVTANSAGSGAGIYNYGTFVATDSVINGNLASDWGGGLYNDRGNATLNRVTLYGNNANKDGGGIYSSGSGAVMTLTNVTLSSNIATGNGGGLFTNRGVTATNVTIAFNEGAAGAGVFGQGGSGIVTFRNSILINPAGGNANKAMVSLGYNIDSDGTAGLTGPADQNSVNPMLDPSLENNGGYVPTHRLLINSPAINMGTSVSAPTVDARSVSRVATPDIGAYEYVPTLIRTGELTVNGTTGQSQETSGQTRGSTQAVSITPSGNYVVVWTSNQSTGSDTNGRGVLMRTFRPDGTPLTGEIQVNQTTISDQQWATVSTDDAGNGVVVWTSTAQDNGSSTGVYARRFNATGALVGNEFLVNTTTAGAQENSVVDMSGSGAFVVAWSGNGTGDTGGIFYRRFDANGTPLDATERLANATNRGVELAPSIAMNDAGQFAIAWQVGGDVFVRNFAANGIASTADIQVDFSPVNASSAVVGIDATGRTIVVHRIDDYFLAQAGVWGRLFNADGTERHAWVSVATGIGSDFASPSIATDDAGNFVVTYQGSGDGSGNAVFVKRYDADFNILGVTQQANTTTAGNQQMSSVAMLDPNYYVVVWSGQGPGDSAGVFARQFSIVGAAPVITSNGGGTSAAINVVENTTAVSTVTATDADLPAQTLTYSIFGGADAGKFTIDASTGELSFISAPDYEIPTDAGPNNVYEVTVQVSDGSLFDTQAISVTVTNTNDTPPAVSMGQSFAVSEIATNGTSLGTVAATDADGATTFSNWTITGGNNDGVFGIDASTGELTVVNRTTLNFTITPSYTLSVTVSDGVNTSAVQNVTVTVIDSPNNAPVAIDDSYTVLEGGTLNQAVVPGWFNSNWEYRQKLVFNNAASSANLINNAVLVKLHATAADAIRIDYSATQDAGEDLRLVDPDGTVLAYEIEKWDESGYSYVWVKVPQIDAGSTTDSIFMYYGNSIAAAGQNSANVWRTNDVAVFHMNANSADSSSNANNGSPTSVVAAAGQIASSGAFDGLNSSINAHSATSVDNIFVGGGAISAWINPVSWGEGGYGRIADKGTSTTGALGWGFQAAGTTTADGYLVFESDFTTSVGRWRTAAGTISQNAWQNVAVVYDNSSATNVPKIYVNGTQLSLTVMSTPVGTARSDAAQDLYIGNRSGASDRTFSGRIDEVRFSSTSLTADQIKADYKSAAGTFITAGSVESGPGGLLDNDIDADGDVLTVSLVSGPAHAASFTLNTDGSFTYVHDGSETTADSFVYRVSDGSLTNTATASLTITPMNDNNPVITSNGGGATATINVAENSTAVTTVTATDADLPAQTLTYSISGGTDATKFSINSTNGTLTFVTAPNFEIPTDVGTNNVYNVTVRVSDGTFADTQAIAVTVTAVNDNTPVITSNGGGATASINVAENATAVTTVTATDADLPAQTLTYSISGGADATKFSINSTNGTLTFVTAPNFEIPTDVGTNNVYNVTVRVSDGTFADTQAIAVTVTAVNDNNPVITSNGGGATASINVAENATAVTTVTATDADLPAQTLTYSISGGADAAKFTINSSNGALTFVAAPDFENPTDVGTNNVYNVTVRVTDGTLTDTQAIAVTVTAVNDNNPVITSNGGGATASINVAENATAATTVTATDADLPTQTLTYSISGGADAAKFSISGSTGVLSFITAPDFESPTDNGNNNAYDVTVRVTDGALTDTQAIVVTVTNTDDTAPVITAGQTFSVAETAGNGTSLGSVLATDADGSTTFGGWTIVAGNNAGVFSIHALTGALTVADRTNLNFDITPSYTLSVRVSDGINTSAVQTITINVIESQNNAPVANADSYSLLEGGTLNQTVVSGWFNSNWQYRRQLVFDNSASSSNLIDNAVLVKLHATASDAIQIDYSATQDAGQDLRFVDSTGTVLAYQIEQWDESGYSYVWVKVPQINAGSTTDSISMYYGNANIAAGQNADAVWSSNLVAVFHMNGNAGDSTAFTNNGTLTNIATASGQVANALTFDGVDSRINAGSASSVDDIFAGGGAISAWINPVSWGETGYGRIADKGTTSNSALGWGFRTAGTNTSDGYVLFKSDFTGTTGRWQTSAGTVSLNSWQNVAVVYDNSSATNVPQIFVNGVQLAVTQVTAQAGTAQSDAGQNLFIGNRSGASDRTFDGRIDEVRFSNTALSVDQILADYKTVSGTYVTAGSVQTGPGGLLDNDFDVDGNLLIVSLVSGPTHAASFALNPDGSFTYVHDGSETTADSFTYQVTDGSLTSTATVTLAITPVNDNAPVITSNGGGATASVSVAENVTDVTTVTATDTDRPTQTLTYSISAGADASKFTINGSTGILRFVTAPNFEIPTDAGANNVYDVIVRVGDGTLFTTQAIAVTITPVNDNAPVITSNGGGATAAINVAENTAIVTTVTATDADLPAQTLTYLINGGVDAAKFTINSSTGVLRFVTAPDYENPTDVGTDNVYNVRVRVIDGNGRNDTQTMAVTVTPVNDNAPVITSNGAGSVTASISVAENSTAVTTVFATDADLPAQTLTYSIFGGADAATFTIDSATGVLSFLTAPNFENPTDGGSDNVYDVIVRASDGTLFVNQAIAVSVINVDESPTANTGGSYTISEGNDLTLVAGISIDPEGLPLTYAWDIDGDGVFTDATGNTATLTWSQLASLPIAVNDDGVRTIALQVTDAGGNATVATTTLIINNTPPTVIVTGNATTSSGTPYTINLTSSDPGADTIASYLITWGDGTTQTIAGTATSATHTFLHPGGTRLITVDATDEDGTFPMTGSPLVVSVDSTTPSAPTLSNTRVASFQNGATVGTLSFTDPDVGDSHTWTVSDNRFTVTGSTLKLKPGQQLNPLTEPTVTLTVTVTDASGAAASTSFTLQVNNAPLSADDAYAVDGTRQLSVSSPSVGVLANDLDADGDTFVAALVSGPTHAIAFGLNQNGTFWYRATTGYSGVDTFTYRATDGINSGELTTVTLTVNQPATLSYNALFSSIPEHQTLATPLKLGVVTVADDGLGTNTLTLAGPDAALFTLDENNNLFLNAGLTIDFDVRTRFEVKLQLDDPSIVGSPDATQTLIFTVQDLNEVPTATDLPDVTVLEDASPGTISTASAFFDRDGDTLTHSLQVVSVTPALIKTISINSTTGVISYSLNANAFGTAVLRVTGTDPSNASASQQFQLNVQSVNDAPVVQNYSNSTLIGQTLSIGASGVLTAASDADFDALSVTLVSGTANGTIVLQANGAFVYTPHAGFFGVDTFRFIVSDGVLSSQVATASIYVFPMFAGPNGGSTSSGGSNSGTQTSTGSSAGSGSSANGSSSAGTGNNGSGNSGTAQASSNGSSNSTTGAVDPLMAGLLNPGLSGSTNANGDNNDDDIVGILPTMEATLAKRIAVIINISESATADRSGTSDFTRHVGGAFAAQDFDVIFSQTGTSEELVRLNAEREVLYRQLADHVDGQSDSVNEQLEQTTRFKGRVVGSVGVVTTGFSVGYLFWAVRLGTLASGLLAQVPAWSMLDPLLVIDGDQKEEDKESLENIMDRQQAKMHKIQEISPQAENP